MIRALVLLVAVAVFMAGAVIAADAPVSVSGDVQQSKLVKKVRPEYPAEVKAAGIQGLVRLEVIIDRQGLPKSVKVVKGPKELTESAVAAVKQWQWTPTKVDDKVVEVITTVDVNYVLAKDKK